MCDVQMFVPFCSASFPSVESVLWCAGVFDFDGVSTLPGFALVACAFGTRLRRGSKLSRAGRPEGAQIAPSLILRIPAATVRPRLVSLRFAPVCYLTQLGALSSLPSSRGEPWARRGQSAPTLDIPTHDITFKGSSRGGAAF